MIDFFKSFFSSDHYMPHGHCYMWEPGILGLHIVSDALIALAYFSIPFTLFYFARKRKDLEFNWMFICFAVFIVACGATHLMEIWVIWHPTYWVSGAIKAITALASVPTAVLLAKLMPAALRLPSPSALQNANAELAKEIVERKAVQDDQLRLTEELERRIIDGMRTEEALRESEGNFRQLVDNITDVFWMTSPDLNTIHYVSPGYERIWGHSVASLHARPHQWLEAILPEQRDHVFAAFRTLREDKPHVSVEYQITRPDGSIRWVQDRGFQVRDRTGNLIRLAGIVTDITERVNAEGVLKFSHAQLRALSTRLQSVREEEAIRIAREIHDELGQMLTGLKMDLLWAERKLGELGNSAPVNAILERVVSATEVTDGIVVAVQEIATELRPVVLDRLGLCTALQYEARRCQTRTGLVCETYLMQTEPVFPPELSTSLYRIFQECLTNVVRHALASKVEVELKVENGWVILRIQDNGRGITQTELACPNSLGLAGMRERVGSFGGEIRFQKGLERGTLVTIRFPYNANLS